MLVYRIAGTGRIQDLSGAGARMYGGRWNQKGIAVVYTSENRALATVEYLVHTPISCAPGNLSIASIKIPDRIKPLEIKVSDLPSNWRDYPAPPELEQIGTGWMLKKTSLSLRVPSAAVEHEFNILINPLHKDMKYVSVSQIEEFRLDGRLIK